MSILKIKGWETGRNKVAMTKLLEERLGMDKKQSTELAQAIHGGQVIRLNFENSEAAENLAAELEEVGAKVSVEDV